MAINYTINLPLETTPIIVREGTSNDDTSLRLVGHTGTGYGEAYANNFIRLLTNFAGLDIDSTKRRKGQIWFKDGNLKFFDGTNWKTLAVAGSGDAFGVTQGGTGLTSIGSPRQVLRVAEDGTSLTYGYWWEAMPSSNTVNLGSPVSRFNEIHATYFRGPADSANTANSANFATTASTASRWETARTISLTGDVTGSLSIDGSANVSMVATVSTAVTNQFLLTSGGVLSGALTLAGDAVTASQPTTLSQVNALINSAVNTGENVGKVEYWYSNSAPLGTLILDGSLVNRTDFPLLWSWVQAKGVVVSDAAWIGGQFGMFSSGNGSSTFRLPDLRGEFIRGWDKGRGIDASRTLGSWQNGSIIVGEEFNNSVNSPIIGGDYAKWGLDNPNSQTFPTNLAGMAVSASYVWDVDNDRALHTGISRPRNVALLITVRYR